MTLEEQKDGARRMVEMLIKEGFSPTDCLGCALNAAMVLADMTGATCGYVSSGTQSVMLSEVGKEQDSLDHIMSQTVKIRTDTAERAAAEARIEAGGTNVFSINGNKTIN